MLAAAVSARRDEKAASLSRAWIAEQRKLLPEVGCDEWAFLLANAAFGTPQPEPEAGKKRPAPAAAAAKNKKQPKPDTEDVDDFLSENDDYSHMVDDSDSSVDPKELGRESDSESEDDD